jgi:hypothetical protein
MCTKLEKETTKKKEKRKKYTYISVKCHEEPKPFARRTARNGNLNEERGELEKRSKKKKRKKKKTLAFPRNRNHSQKELQ